MFIIQTEPSIISAALKSLLRQIYGDGQKLSYETQTLTQPRYTLSKTMALRHRNIIRPPLPLFTPGGYYYDTTGLYHHRRHHAGRNSFYRIYRREEMIALALAILAGMYIGLWIYIIDSLTGETK
jgi:hypothetical protein